jgi:hypothetical protein
MSTIYLKANNKEIAEMRNAIDNPDLIEAALQPSVEQKQTSP